MQPDETPVAEEVAPELSPAPYPFWGWLDLFIALGLLAGMIGFIFVLAAGATVLVPSLKTNQTPLLLPLQIALYAAIYLTFFLVIRLRYGKPVFSSLGWRRTVTERTIMLIGLGGFLLSPAVSIVASLLHTPEVHIDALEQLEKYPLILAAFGVMAVTIAPLFEELLFRGFLQPLLCRSLGILGGILLTALLFGALHAPEYKFAWQYVAAISFVGFVLGVVRYRTGSIIPSTVMHACYNAVAAIAILFHHNH